VIKPKPLQSPVEGGFTVDDFTVNEADATVTCPNGNTRPMSTTRIATFGPVSRLSAARAMHHVQNRPEDRPTRTR